VTNVIIIAVTVMTLLLKPPVSLSNPGTSFLLYVTVLSKTHIFCTVCVGKSTFVLLTLLIPTVGCPLSNRCCRCAGIVLQNGCQVANRVTDLCGESVIHGITSEISRQRAGCNWCGLVNIKWFDFNNRGCFL